MKKILFSIFTDGYPNQISGGPNNIIYKLLSSYKKNLFKIDYLSYDLFLENLNCENLLNVKKSLPNKKKVTSYLFENSKLYQKVFSSDFYLPIHFYKKERKFKNFQTQIENYDILHSHDSVSLYYLKDRISSSKKIMTIHSKGPLSDELKQMPQKLFLQNKIDKRFKKIEKNNIELSDIITFPSYAAKDYFENSLEVKLPNEKVKIIYNGIDIDYINSIKTENEVFSKYGIEKKDRTVLINVAAHSPEKNIDLLIKLVTLLTRKYKQKVLLINIGLKNFKFDYQNKVNSLGLENNIIFLGKISHDDVIRFIKSSDIFIMMSQKVIFDLVVLEALACGACCVVSKDGGNKEIIKDCENGYLIDIDNIEIIAEKIIYLDINKVKVSAMATAREFSFGKMTNEYFQLYENLLNGI